MAKSIQERVRLALRRFNTGYGRDISTPKGRFEAHLHNNLSDHAFLRSIWNSWAEIAPGVYRSNQPNVGHFRRIERLGIKTIFNLRGETGYSYYLFEAREAKKRGIKIINLPLNPRAADTREAYLELFDVFETIEKPCLIHCKSGADRTGIAAALYLMHIEGKSLDEARGQLHIKFLHTKGGKTGVLDHILDAYEADTAGQMPIRDWFETRYDPQAITESYRRKREGQA